MKDALGRTKSIKNKSLKANVEDHLIRIMKHEEKQLYVLAF